MARAYWDDHEFMGHRAFAELLGRQNFWSLVSIAVGGPRLGPEDCRVMDDLACCMAVADPHIWPMKLVRLASAFGRATVGFCCAFLAFEGSMLGQSPVHAAALLLVDLHDWLGESVGDPDAVAAAVARVRASGRRLAGFGVPFRPRDERVVALAQALGRRGRTEGRYWRLALAVERVLAPENLPMNIAGGLAAVWLDLGFRPEHVPTLCWALGVSPYGANAVEGAQQAPEVLRRLPDEFVRYEGPPPRQSPRALGEE